MLRRVIGDSMRPALKPDDIVVSLPLRVAVGDVVVARQDDREVIKRVAKIDESGYFLIGDNMAKSTDSRKHGSVKKSDVLGRVVARLPKAEAPVKSKSQLANYLSYVLAALLVCLSIANLSQIDRLAAALNDSLPGSQTFAGWTTSLIVLSQLFAIPYLLRLKLSPLAHAVSGILSVLAPLIWCLVAIWGLGQKTSVGLLSGYVDLPASWQLAVLLLLWLSASYANLYYRNFETQARVLAKRV